MSGLPRPYLGLISTLTGVTMFEPDNTMRVLGEGPEEGPFRSLDACIKFLQVPEAQRLEEVHPMDDSGIPYSHQQVRLYANAVAGNIHLVSIQMEIFPASLKGVFDAIFRSAMGSSTILRRQEIAVVQRAAKIIWAGPNTIPLLPDDTVLPALFGALGISYDQFMSLPYGVVRNIRVFLMTSIIIRLNPVLTQEPRMEDLADNEVDQILAQVDNEAILNALTSTIANGSKARLTIARLVQLATWNSQIVQIRTIVDGPQAQSAERN